MAWPFEPLLPLELFSMFFPFGHNNINGCYQENVPGTTHKKRPLEDLKPSLTFSSDCNCTTRWHAFSIVIIWFGLRNPIRHIKFKFTKCPQIKNFVISYKTWKFHYILQFSFSVSKRAFLLMHFNFLNIEAIIKHTFVFMPCFSLVRGCFYWFYSAL